MIESLSCGALVVASDTAPVKEVITDGENGFLVDFFDHEAFADRLAYALDNHKALGHMREAARKTVLENYALKDLLPRHLRLIKDVANGTLPPMEAK